MSCRTIADTRVYYRPQTKLREGIVFTPVSQSFCSQGWGGGSLYGVTSYLATWSHVPFRGSLSGGLPDRDTPGQRSPLYGKEQAIRILIECILVLIFI